MTWNRLPVCARDADEITPIGGLMTVEEISLQIE